MFIALCRMYKATSVNLQNERAFDTERLIGNKISNSIWLSKWVGVYLPT